MEIYFHKNCIKEIERFPDDARRDLYEIIEGIAVGVRFSFPIIREIKGVGPSILELRIRSLDGAYRVFYFQHNKKSIVFLHAFQKKTQKTPTRTLHLVKKRMRSFDE